MRHATSTVRFKLGLRPEENSRGEDVWLTQANNVIMEENALHSFEFSDLIVPDPVIQIERLRELILVVSSTTIYELENSVLVPKIAVNSTSQWGVADFGSFILLVRPDAVIQRDPLTHAYSYRSDVPEGWDTLNYNGQCIVVGSSHV